MHLRQVLHQRLCHLVQLCNRQRRMDQRDLHLEDLHKNQVMVLFRFLWVRNITGASARSNFKSVKRLAGFGLVVVLVLTFPQRLENFKS